MLIELRSNATHLIKCACQLVSQTHNTLTGICFTSRFLGILLVGALFGVVVQSQTLINAIGGGGGYNDANCALILSGGGRSSAFDYNLNMFRGNYGQMPQHVDRTCITYASINNAYLDARKRISNCRSRIVDVSMFFCGLLT